ncbi:ABC-type cobalamin/Fe3+-siderophores transport system, ATPase component [Salipiger mucosus DSM 16094]|uniref:ABC-type cobalamin/Fe3+-siderophores transport system, ATPase component n=1 Tax=Salipiger mucosus DSM 16094 TaxID=1123237 RepID=S9S9T2_9RHOB|nr:ABC-type cobalamin/Fe3+-siderophores transport system, ATPase component [Salipiger mucosus DSM 16094]
MLAFSAPLGAETARFAGRLTWTSDEPGFGGFSGLEVSEDGSTFTAISDRAMIVSGRFIREGGRLTSIETGPLEMLPGPDGGRMARKVGDAEGLAQRADGRLFVSFEGVARVWAYVTPDKAARLPRPDAFKTFERNAGPEALAIDGQGRLYTLPERSGQMDRPFPVWRLDARHWDQPFDIPRRGPFLPVGADFGPDGRLYLLERNFTGYSFRSRVRRFTLDADRIVAEEQLLETASFRHGNLEGLSVWRDESGAIRLTMVADDNFSALQRSEIVEYSLPESLASAPPRP